MLTDETGRLFLKVIVEEHSWLHAFQPLEVDGEPKVILIARWRPGGADLMLNGVELLIWSWRTPAPDSRDRR